ncbi:uncharacterized protein CCOS01_02650 [Colletotrichum costaricense]|uniref:Uncharacterized protein n=2 Tax=Colletotrichum acutatum species complex TaxID=2707335 RepID=A0AAI9Z8D1_9PEZI|nr:uncharacterized protein CCOS01_02650 [Colletotrichum costaricense]XP_060383240.1 uncharacterized protein CTAM01_06020 [Colletotrichum tamarilloi]KAK1501295.1 hypothetical protein CTAM01_06020 [Colletotrichum tamarilloi]KAK1537330.1 hypothetical protein CCOS01_02650 [Colletotrichum costaricense]
MIFLTLLVVKSSVRTILAELSRPAAVEMNCDLIGTGSRIYLAQGCFMWGFTQWTWEPHRGAISLQRLPLFYIIKYASDSRGPGASSTQSREHFIESCADED